MPSTTFTAYFLASSVGTLGWQALSRLNFSPCTGQVTRVPCSLPLLSEPPACGQLSSMAYTASPILNTARSSPALQTRRPAALGQSAQFDQRDRRAHQITMPPFGLMTWPTR